MRRLYKSRESKIIDGVCGGIAEYFEVDPVLIRLLAVLFFFAGGITAIAYIVGMIIMPRRPLDGINVEATVVEPQAAPIPGFQSDKRGSTGTLIAGIVMIVLGLHFLLRHIPFFSPFYWWFWDMGGKFFWPLILILTGLYILYRGTRGRAE